MNSSLNSRSGAFWSAQCGNYSATSGTGFISGENLRINTIRHEADRSAQSHWVYYRTAQDNASNNLGAFAEAQAAPGIIDGFHKECHRCAECEDNCHLDCYGG
jgi:hypothetical protein